MIRIVLVTAALAVSTPAVAQDSDMREGADLLEEGAKLLLRGLMTDMAPAISRMEELAKVLGDIDEYHAPEVLPNGDVILRRKVPLIPGPPGTEPGGEVDL